MQELADLISVKVYNNYQDIEFSGVNEATPVIIVELIASFWR